VRARARELGIDANRILAAGGSSGGHLALSAAMFDQFDDRSEDQSISARPDALVLLFPCVDLTSEDERRYSAMALGNHGEDVSPLFHVRPNLPPMAIYQGTADPIYAGVAKFATQATTAGARVQFKVYEGARHGFTRLDVENGKWFRDVWAEADRFLVGLGYVPGPAQAPK
jgi:acetyl esterase/lipase